MRVGASRKALRSHGLLDARKLVEGRLHLVFCRRGLLHRRAKLIDHRPARHHCQGSFVVDDVGDRRRHRLLHLAINRKCSCLHTRVAWPTLTYVIESEI